MVPSGNDISRSATHVKPGRAIVLVTTLIVILIVTTIIRRYKNKIVSITISEELKYHTILQNATSQIYDSIIEFDITNNIACGEGTKKFLQQLNLKPGTSYSAMLQTIVSKYIHPDHAAQFMATFSPDAVRTALEENRNKLSCDFLYATHKNNYVWYRETGYVLRWAENDSIHIVICRQNIDKEKKIELSLQEMAQKDGLTGLYNKMTTHDLIEKRLAEHECDRGLLAMIMLDIDNFKELNDSLGHVAGDRIIQEFAQSIRAGFAADDIVGRVGGDEFVVLTLQQDDAALRQKVDDICRSINRDSFGCDGHHLAASMGVVVFPRHGKTFGDLYAKADAALYRAKQNGKNTFVIFDSTRTV